MSFSYRDGCYWIEIISAIGKKTDLTEFYPISREAAASLADGIRACELDLGYMQQEIETADKEE